MINCGKGTLTRPHPLKPGTFQYLRATCKKLSCSECGEGVAKRYREAILKLATKHKLIRHLVLTLDPKKLPEGVNSVDYIAECWSRFRALVYKQRGVVLHYVRVLEFQENGNAHYHILINECFAKETLIEWWTQSGGGYEVWISIPPGKQGPNYVTKYLTKEFLEQIPRGRRRVTTSQSLRLFEATLPSGWEYNPLGFYDCIALALGWSWSEAITSSIDRYFEAESPPEDKTAWAMIYADDRQ